MAVRRGDFFGRTGDGCGTSGGEGRVIGGGVWQGVVEVSGEMGPVVDREVHHLLLKCLMLSEMLVCLFMVEAACLEDILGVRFRSKSLGRG